MRIFHKVTYKGEGTNLKLLLYTVKHSDAHFPLLYSCSKLVDKVVHCLTYFHQSSENFGIM